MNKNDNMCELCKDKLAIGDDFGIIPVLLFADYKKTIRENVGKYLHQMVGKTL